MLGCGLNGMAEEFLPDGTGRGRREIRKDFFRLFYESHPVSFTKVGICFSRSRRQGLSGRESYHNWQMV